MIWAQAVAAATLVLTALWLPGALLLLAFRVTSPRLDTTVLAPITTLTLVAATSVCAGVAGIRWSVGLVLALVACLVLVGVAVTRARSGSWPAGARRLAARGTDRVLVGAIVAGVLLQVAPVAVAMRDPRNLPGSFDAVAHFALVRWMRDSGDASSLHAAAAWSLEAHPGYYPAAWHAVVTLVPPLPDLTTVLNVAALLSTTIPWTTGIALLARTVLPARPRVWRWAAVLSAAPLSLPVYLAFGTSGLLANAVALALLPGVAAVALAFLRRPGVQGAALSLVGVAAVGATHPNTVLSLAPALAPACVVLLVTRLRMPRVRNRDALLVVGILASLGAGLTLLVRSRILHGVASYDGRPPRSLLSTVTDVLGGAVDNGGYPGGAVVVIGAAVGLWTARRCAAPRQATWAALVLATWLVLIASPPPGLDLGGPWYGEPRRFAPVLSAFLVPFAALTLDSAGQAVRLGLRRVRPATSVDRRATLRTAGALAAVAVLVGPFGLYSVAHATFHGSALRNVMASQPELAMAARLPGELGPGRVLGNPLAGAGYLQSVQGIPVVPLTPFPPAQDDANELLERYDSLGRDPALCATVRRWDIRYVYVDPEPTAVFVGHQRIAAPPPGSTLVDSGGSAAVYRLGVCW